MGAEPGAGAGSQTPTQDLNTVDAKTPAVQLVREAVDKLRYLHAHSVAGEAAKPEAETQGSRT